MKEELKPLVIELRKLADRWDKWSGGDMAKHNNCCTTNSVRVALLEVSNAIVRAYPDKTVTMQNGAAFATDPDWICDECAANYVRNGHAPLANIWGVNNIPYRQGKCSICHAEGSLCNYPFKYIKP